LGFHGEQNAGTTFHGEQIGRGGVDRAVVRVAMEISDGGADLPWRAEGGEWIAMTRHRVAAACHMCTGEAGTEGLGTGCVHGERGGRQGVKARIEGRGGENDDAKDVGEDGGASIAGMAEMTGAGARWTPSLDPYRIVEICYYLATSI
jgi:hypothetical protein